MIDVFLSIGICSLLAVLVVAIIADGQRS